VSLPPMGRNPHPRHRLNDEQSALEGVKRDYALGRIEADEMEREIDNILTGRPSRYVPLFRAFATEAIAR
jgi:hypothetical protein